MTDPPAQVNPDLTQDLVDQIKGPDPADETYLAKLSRLNMANLQAAELTRTTGTDVDDCPLPPTRPADPTHPLNTEYDQMSDHDFQQALHQWRNSPEYQEPQRRYTAWLQQRARS